MIWDIRAVKDRHTLLEFEQLLHNSNRFVGEEIKRPIKLYT